MVVRPLKYCPNALGMVVEILQVDERYVFTSGPAHAAYIRAATKLKNENGLMTHEGWCKQISLRSIRDPGDDAQDETLSWLPVPSREEVSA